MIHHMERQECLPALCRGNVSQFSFHAEISQELLNDSTVEIWRHHIFYGINSLSVLPLCGINKASNHSKSHFKSCDCSINQSEHQKISNIITYFKKSKDLT